MCGKMGKDELDSVKNMMTMSAYFVIAEALDMDVMDLDVSKELNLTETARKELNDKVMDMFNGRKLDFDKIHKLEDVVNQIIRQDEWVVH